jgi:hypothetical protein
MTKLHRLHVLVNYQQTFTDHYGTQNVFGTRILSAAVDVWYCTKNSPCRGRSNGPRRTEMAYVLSSTDKNGFVLDRVSMVAHVRVKFAKTVCKPPLQYTCVLLHLSLPTYCSLLCVQFVNRLS